MELHSILFSVFSYKKIPQSPFVCPDIDNFKEYSPVIL